MKIAPSGMRVLALAIAAGLAACASSPSMLIFADNVTFGLQLGTNTAAGGSSVTLGFKNRSVAIVPMSVLDQDGNAQKLSSLDGGNGDAMSVFAVFDASSSGQSSPLKAGQMFSTGVAAQQLTLGYLCRTNPQAAQCHVEPPAGSASASAKLASAHASTAGSAASSAQASAKSAAASASSAAAAAGSIGVAAAPPAPPPPANDRPYQWPLVFGRTDVVGFDISGSAAEQGGTFVFGYGGRNLALVPAYTPSKNSKVSGLYAKSDGIERDAFSVLGQFDANTETTKLGFDIKRYFATGLAAQNLSRSIASAIAASASASAPKP